MSTSTAITQNFLLPDDVLMTPITSLPELQRFKIDASDSDFVLTRLNSRSHSKVVSAEMVTLIEEFRREKTIIEAIVAFSSQRKDEPEAVLDGAYPILRELIQARFLVPPGVEDSRAITASLSPGDIWDGFKVTRLVQLLDDTEIFQALTPDDRPAALKVLRRAKVESRGDLIFREAAILRQLDGRNAPRLLACATFQGRPYLASEWCPGVSAAQEAARIRNLRGEAALRGLHRLCCTVLEVYARLHDAGVVHGDVHPNNILVGEDGKVTLIDFGVSLLTSSRDPRLASAPRSGAGFFFEPEYAKGWLAGRSPQAASFLGEQHIVAHLLYRLMTGHEYQRFSVEKSEAMRQIADGKQEPFSCWGLPPWPEVEGALEKALSTKPSQRFASLSDFHARLSATPLPRIPDQTGPESPFLSRIDLPQSFLDKYVKHLAPEGSLLTSPFPQTPRCSINYGSGGIAFFLYRLSIIRESAELLSLSKLWIEKAVREAQDFGDEAFYNPNMGLSREVLGDISLYHSMTGIFAVQALIANAMDDILTRHSALEGFVNSARQPCANIDLTLGKSGVLLGCALLLESCGTDDLLSSLGRSLLSDIWSEVGGSTPMVDKKTLHATGIAHGWGGFLYAILYWCRASGEPLPEGVEERLDQLAFFAEPNGRGVRWPREIRPDLSAEQRHDSAGWCNGTAGMVFLWTLAHRTFAKDRYLGLAIKSADHVEAHPERINQLCCGLPGQGYSLLNLYKHTRDDKWLALARNMAEESHTMAAPPVGAGAMAFYDCLYKGPLGAGLLLADVTNAPDQAYMPLFEGMTLRSRA